MSILLGRDYTYTKTLDSESNKIFDIKFNPDFVGKIKSYLKGDFTRVFVKQNLLEWKGQNKSDSYPTKDELQHTNYCLLKDYAMPGSSSFWGLLSEYIIIIIRQIKQEEIEREVILDRFNMIVEEM